LTSFVIFINDFLNSLVNISFSSLLFEAFYCGVVGFCERAFALLLNVSVLGYTHLGAFLVGNSNPLCPFIWAGVIPDPNYSKWQ
jgi:hypothetical protein